jgi:preprotein translocase subunit SecG
LNLFGVLLVIHVLICVALIVVVLMQSAKGEGLAGAFGGGGGGLTGAVFGGRGAASFLSKATTVLAIFFMVSCMGLSLLSAGRSTQSSAAATSGVTEAAQEDMAAQQQAQQEKAAQQQAQQQGQKGESALPEDIFNVKPASEGQQQQQTQPQTQQAQPQKPDSQ